MLQRAVYALEMGFHSGLHIRGLDLCLVDEYGFQVDSSREENEPLFQALFWHAQVWSLCKVAGEQAVLPAGLAR